MLSTDLDVALWNLLLGSCGGRTVVDVVEKTVDTSSLLISAGSVLHLGCSLELTWGLGNSVLKPLNQKLGLVILKSFTNNYKFSHGLFIS